MPHSLPVRPAARPVAILRTERTVTRSRSRKPLSANVARALVHHTADGMLVLDSDGKVVVANPAAGKLLEASIETLTGRPLSAILPPESAKWLGEAIATYHRLPTRTAHITLRGHQGTT
jgi:PAS domain S-box-containing protein